MNLPATNPPLTPPGRGTGQPVMLPSWEGLGVGSGAQWTQKVPSRLSLRKRARVRGKYLVEQGPVRGCVFFDADCTFCVGMAERFGGLLSRRRIDLLPLQAPGVPERLSIAAPDLRNEMRYLTQTGELFGGADAVV